MNNDTGSEITKIKPDDFFRLIEEMSSDIEAEILKVQGINNVLSLLRSKDLFCIFNIDYEELKDLRSRACVKTNDGGYIIRPAIKENLDYCINVFKNKLNEPQQYRLDNQGNGFKPPDSFANTFMTNIYDNITRSKYHFQYKAPTRRFASSVYALGGRNLYQFLRLNLPGTFSSITTLESYNNKCCTRIEEGEFRFDELSTHSTKINCSYVYASEDCTGVISKIQYDAATDSIIGFCAELTNGIPTVRQYQTNDSVQPRNGLRLLSDHH